ncbi:MAG: gliding motility-associated C-terminal domain-containing protein [Crocinitomicaceae bacterium]|nr:gliding motility-associated C-terminal domain-containing protein [Crocinitomicaceae bacterium]
MEIEFIDLVNPNAEIIIINRWGQTLFHSYGYPDPFDGTYKGELLREGTYFYIIKISDEEIYEGSLLILTAKND